MGNNDYHKYVYDFKKRTILNKMEEMYQECECPWPHQVDAESVKYRFVKECLRSSEPISILDLGCGLGYFSHELTELGHVTAVDVSATCIEKARAKFPNIVFYVGDMMNGLDHESDSFEGVVVLGVLWFVLPKIDFVMEEINRVLKIGGKAVFGLHIPEDPIGKEVIGNKSDFYRLVSRHMNVLNVFSCYHIEGQDDLVDANETVYVHAEKK